jgi:hypothetical protein
MTLEETIVAKLQRVPEGQRERVLVLIDEWIEQHRMMDTEEVQRAAAIVEKTWATLTLNQETLRWVAEDKELEYDLG